MKKLILFIALFFTALEGAMANQVTLVKDRMDNIYSHYYDTTTNKNRFFHADKYVFEENIAYCLEIGKKIESNIYTYSTSFDNYNINEEDLAYLKLITYYGYDYPNHQTDEYYMATQELIWNRTCNASVNWIVGLVPTNIIDVSEEKNNILNLVNTHYEKPSFDKIEIKYTLGERMVLEDTNNVLDRFIAVNDNVIIEGNKLIIEEDFSDEEIIFIKPTYNQKQFFLYTSGASQKMMSSGELPSVISSVKVKLTGGTLEVIKLDKDTGENIPQGEASLDGAIYELFDEKGNLIDIITTGIKNEIKNLKIGKYSLKEKIPSNGYGLDDNTYNIEVSKDRLNIKINVYEEVIKREIKIFKVFASDKTGLLIPESNITFEIYNKAKILIDRITTDEDGYANVLLPYGTYTFKQINSTENYYKVNDFNVTVDIYDERPIYKLLSDSEIKSKIKIIKKDLDTGENINNSNIKFKIYDVNNSKYLSMKVSYPENRETTEFQVDKNGIFISPVELSAGKYIIEEIQEPMDGYLYNPEKITLIINENSNFIEEDSEIYLEIPFYNKRVKGTIDIIKYGEELIYKDNSYYYKEVYLEGVLLNLYAKDNIYENNKIIYKKDELIKKVITDKEGKYKIDNLPLGNYYIKEISTINNHLLDENIYDVTLKYKDENTKIINSTVKIKNYLPKGNLVINKYETDTTNPISNTLIEVYTSDNKLMYKGYTDNKGQISLIDLPYGKYYLSETEASTGYRLLEDKIFFEINSNEKIVDIYNERIKVPNTGFTLNMLDIIIILSTLIIFLLLITLTKTKRGILLSILIIILVIIYFTIRIYNYYKDYQSNEKSISAYINNNIEIIPDEKYKYNSIIEIPSINLKRGILDINNKYNDAKYNIEILKDEENIIILAAHNGTNNNSYFGKLSNLELGDYINYYKEEKIYKYIYTESYDIDKNGYADIYRKDDKKCIILITCKNNTDDAQTVYIGYLEEVNTY